LEEATARLKGDYATDIASYDKVHDAMMEMSDMLADGIIAQFPDKFSESTASQAEQDLTLAMDKLWEDHITWTRVVIIDVAAGLPDTDVAVGRLLENQDDIGNAIKPFYGDAAGQQLTTLLRTHIGGAADILVAVKAGDQAKQDAAIAAWYANANDIAAFLNRANPNNWPLDALQSNMKMHLDLTLAEAVARFSGDWTLDAAAYDNVHDHILMMADILSEGIIKQFPDKFK